MSETTNLLNFIVDRANVGIFVINREREIVLWNQFMEINSDRRADTVVGKNLFETFPELPQKWLDRKIENLLILKNFPSPRGNSAPIYLNLPTTVPSPVG